MITAGEPNGRAGRFFLYEGERMEFRREVSSLVLGLCLVGAEAFSAQAQKPLAPNPTFDFGKAVRGAVIEHGYLLRNEGPSVIGIRIVRATPPLVVESRPKELASSAEGTVRLRLDTTGVTGVFQGAAAVSFDSPDLPD